MSVCARLSCFFAVLAAVAASAGAVQETKLTASDGAAADNFGYAVSVDGDRALVGAYHHDGVAGDSGAAYVFRWNGSAWVQQAKLTASDGAWGDYFGCSVSLDGDCALIGAYSDDDLGIYCGAAYVFEWNGTNWVQTAKLTAADGEAYDRFGTSVSLDADRAVVGADGEAQKGANAGAAYVFKRVGSTWTQEAKLTASHGTANDYFGKSVALDGDVALIGADNTLAAGVDGAYVFRRIGTAWVEEANLSRWDGTGDAHFGCAVSVAGDVALIGSHADQSNGGAYVFRRDGSEWAPEAKLTAPDGATYDRFGCSVCVRGDAAVIGAYGDDAANGGYDAGAAYAFRHNGGGAWQLSRKLTASDAAAYDFFGWSVSLSGDRALAGAYGNDARGSTAGAAYVFDGLMANTAPVSHNQGKTAVMRAEIAIDLSYTDPDAGQTMRVRIVSGPAKGTLESHYARYATWDFPARYYYRSAGAFGTDAFAWEITDGFATSAVATCTITEKANTAPAASNQSTTAVTGVGKAIALAWSDADTGQSHIFRLVTPPSKGRLAWNPTVSDWIYTANWGSSGTDTFTWEVSDGIATSAVATCTVNITRTPVGEIPNLNAWVIKNSSDTPILVPGVSVPPCALVKVSNPAHGTATVSGSRFLYTPAPDYTGADPFTFYVQDGATNSNTATVTVRVQPNAANRDWPLWRCTAQRGAGVVDVPGLADLHLQWIRDLPPVQAAWDEEYTREMERCHWPVVVSNRLYVGLSTRDAVLALDTATGAEVWRFYTDGPVRAGVSAVRLNATTVRVLAGSDDGYLYCLDGETGALVWRHLCGPSTRKLFGNGRVISPWSLRCGLVTAAGAPAAGNRQVVFAMVGQWPAEGVFAWALDAETGAVLWHNDRMGYRQWAPGQHGNAAFAGGPPSHGWLTLSQNLNELYFPTVGFGGAKLDRATGELGEWRQWSGEQYTVAWCEFVNASFTILAVPDPVVIPANGPALRAADAAELGVVGTVGDMLAGDGRLFVVTEQGALYAYGLDAVWDPPVYELDLEPLAAAGDAWATNIAHMLGVTGADAGGCAVVLGAGSGRAAKELLLQAERLHVVVLEPDRANADSLRDALYAAGTGAEPWYGSRVSVLAGDAMEIGLPPYAGRLLVAESLDAVGFTNGQAFVERVFPAIRPYGGTLWLPTTAGEHAQLEGWVAAAAAAGTVTNATVTRDGGFSVLTRAGALPGAVDFDGVPPERDDAARFPFALQWYQKGNLNYVRRVIGQGVVSAPNELGKDVYTGLPTWEKATGTFVCGLEPAPTQRDRWNPMSQEPDEWYGMAYSSCHDANVLAGDLLVRANNALTWYDGKVDSCAIGFPGLAVGCGGNRYANSQRYSVGNGVLYAGDGGCKCSGRQRRRRGVEWAFVHRPEVENWGCWSQRSRSSALNANKPLRHVALNFGAPGDRRDADGGALWLAMPARAGRFRSPFVPVSFASDPVVKYHHVSRIRNPGDRAFVAGSSLAGVTRFQVGLAYSIGAYAAGAAPVVDGLLTDACWTQAGAAPLVRGPHNVGKYSSGFGSYRYVPFAGYELFSDDGPPRLLIRHDDENLYVAMTGHCGGAPAQGHMGTDCSIQWLDISGAWKLLLNDRVRVAAGLPRISLEVTMDGTRTVDGEAPAAGTWQSAWSAAVSSAGDVRRLEVAIPFTALEAAGLWKEQLVLNAEGPNAYVLRTEHRSTTWYGDVTEPRYAPVHWGGRRGATAAGRPHTVKLYFAETEGAAAGERVFDIRLQGQTVAADFDIAAAAGGADRETALSFAGIEVEAMLDVELVPKAGTPLIAGIEIVQQTPHPANMAPTAVAELDRSGGAPPLTVRFDARASFDPNDQIQAVLWTFGDGATNGAAVCEHVYTNAGAYTVTLKVQDEAGVWSPAVTRSVSVHNAPIANAAATMIRPNTATLGAEVVATGAAPWTVWCYWGTNDPGPTAGGWLGGGSAGLGALGLGPFTHGVGGLSGETTYYFRYLATNALGESGWSDVAGVFQTGFDPTVYARKLKIAFAGYTPPGGGVLTNFPALVRLGEGLAGFRYDGFASPAGYDLRFMDATATTELAYEVETWDTNGESCVWVRVPRLAGADDYVRAYWGNPARAAAPPAYATDGSVWDAGFAGVWHLGETLADSSAYGNDGENGGTAP
ncbi:MAG: DUF2341 domain-containing protein, partial [Kiritimatiellae bacterium]|nr:DUF2341 domain-containing protein [Kiritimatiellia bacterium]